MSSKTSYGLTFYINRTKEKKNGECPVMLRININGQRVVLQTKRYLFPQDWDPNRYQMKGRTTEARVFNDYLQALRIKAHKKYNELLSLHDDVTPQMLRDAILGINTAKAKMIIEVWEDLQYCTFAQGRVDYTSLSCCSNKGRFSAPPFFLGYVSLRLRLRYTSPKKGNCCQLHL